MPSISFDDHRQTYRCLCGRDNEFIGTILEMPPPNAMRRNLGLGVDFTKPGDQVTIDLWQAKNGSRLANTLTLTVPDGRVVFNSSRDTTFDWEMVRVPK